jgi:hypothetical protein
VYGSREKHVTGFTDMAGQRTHAHCLLYPVVGTMSIFRGRRFLVYSSKKITRTLKKFYCLLKIRLPITKSSRGRSTFNPLTLNDLQRLRAVSPLKIKIPSKNMPEKPTNTPIIYSVC